MPGLWPITVIVVIGLAVLWAWRRAWRTDAIIQAILVALLVLALLFWLVYPALHV